MTGEFQLRESEIRTHDQDIFGREQFVARLVDALIYEDGGRRVATGVTIGLTGEWGSGKSSVLNLVEESVNSFEGEHICVRFNPWLIGNRSELIGLFFQELITALDGNRYVWQHSFELIDHLKQYANIVGGATDLVFPGSGALASGLAGLTGNLIRRGFSLEALKARIDSELRFVPCPVVVLIDELDRVEDEEVRLIARLVSAVAGFDRISYLVAYDYDRVVQALSAGEGPDRGKSYLEKIIHYQISLPHIASRDLQSMLVSQLLSSLTRTGLSATAIAEDRFSSLCEICVGSIIATPRDVKKIVGAFFILRAMIGNELDWVDLFGFSVLYQRYPDVRGVITNRPDFFAEDAFTLQYLKWSAGLEKKTAAEFFKELGLMAHLNDSPLTLLLEFLFPSFGGRRFERADRPMLPIATMRGIRLASSYGLSAEDVSREEIEGFVALEASAMATHLAELAQCGRLVKFIGEFDELYASLNRDGRVNTWIAAQSFLDATAPDAMDDTRQYYGYADAVSEALLRLIVSGRMDAAEAEEVCRNLIHGGDLQIVPYVLRSHFMYYGIFGCTKSNRSFEALSRQLVEELAVLFEERQGACFRDSSIMTRTWSANAVLALVNIMFSESGDPRALWQEHLDREMTLLFSCLFLREGHVVSYDTVETFFEGDRYLLAVRDAVDSDAGDVPLSTFAKDALNHVLEEFATQ